MKKISIIGAGRVGETAAAAIAQASLCNEIALLDVREGVAAGAARDIEQSAAWYQFDTRIIGSASPNVIADSGLVIVTAGSPRKPGMSRHDVLDINRAVIDNIVDDVLKYAPDAMLLLVTNPVDILTYHAWKRTGWDRNRVFGQAGVLDAARMAGFIAAETGLSARDIHTMVLGGHGDSMVPLIRYSTINGIPAEHFLDSGSIERIYDRTRHGGAEVLELRKDSSAYNAPAAAITAMVDAICHDRKRILPCICVLDGEYGQNDITVGVPAILGQNGIERVIELPLNEAEQAAFQSSIDAVRQGL
jgi:malate dehydrogenase